MEEAASTEIEAPAVAVVAATVGVAVGFGSVAEAAVKSGTGGIPAASDEPPPFVAVGRDFAGGGGIAPDAAPLMTACCKRDRKQ